MLCTHLKPVEVANLRLASRSVASIGLQYLIPEVHLVVAEDSFRQLEAIARHPVVSKYVTSLFYEADILEPYDEKKWKEQIRSPDYFDRLRKRQRYMLRSYKGGYAQACTVPRHQYTKQQLKEAFRKYQRFCAYQNRVDQYDGKIATAMKNFPNLKELTMSAQVRPHKQLFQNAFESGYCTRCREDAEEWPLGLVQMRSLLLGACHAGLKIERLRCREVNWRILAQENKTFESMKRSVRHLRELKITFSTGIEEEEDQWGLLQIEDCKAYLQNGRLKDFVTSAPDLERLDVRFVWFEPVHPAELKHVVGDFCWPSLKSVRFEGIETTEDHLVGFLERHASTIKDLRLGSLLLSHGHWWSVFEKMRLLLKLDSVELSGSLESFSGSLAFERDAEDELREGIEMYLLGHGSGSITD